MKKVTQISSRKERQRLVEKLSKVSHFRVKFEVECLLKKYHELSPKGPMSLTTFREFLHTQFEMTDDIIMDRIFRTFDRDNDSKISEEEWVSGLSVFLRGNLTELTRFCFDVYDMNGDGYITRDEMLHLLKNCLVNKHVAEEDGDESTKDLLELALKKMDKDGDGRVSYSDFEASVMEDQCISRLVIELLGPCLPHYNRKTEFETTVTGE